MLTKYSKQKRQQTQTTSNMFPRRGCVVGGTGPVAHPSVGPHLKIGVGVGDLSAAVDRFRATGANTAVVCSGQPLTLPGKDWQCYFSGGGLRIQRNYGKVGAKKNHTRFRTSDDSYFPCEQHCDFSAPGKKIHSRLFFVLH